MIRAVVPPEVETVHLLIDTERKRNEILPATFSGQRKIVLQGRREEEKQEMRQVSGFSKIIHYYYYVMHANNG